MLTDRQPSDGWSSIDKKLAIAFTILENETCNDCGVPVWIGHSDDKDIQFEVKSRTCYSCAAIEEAQERVSKPRKGRRPARGQKRFLQKSETDKLPSREKYLARQSGVIDEETE